MLAQNASNTARLLTIQLSRYKKKINQNNNQNNLPKRWPCHKTEEVFGG